MIVPSRSDDRGAERATRSTRATRAAMQRSDGDARDGQAEDARAVRLRAEDWTYALRGIIPEHIDLHRTFLNALNLADNGLGAAALVQALVPALQHAQCRLEWLDLGGNGLGAAGAAALVPALQHPQCRLTALFLGSNGLGAAGAAALVPALQHAQCRLTKLDLVFNGLGAAGAAALVPALEHAQCRLTALDFRKNGLGAADEAAVMAALRAQLARTLAAALQRLLFAAALGNSPRLLIAGGRVDLTRLDAARPGGGSAMPRSHRSGMVQYLDPDEPAARVCLERSVLFGRKAASAVGARFEAQGWAWRDARPNASKRAHSAIA